MKQFFIGIFLLIIFFVVLGESTQMVFAWTHCGTPQAENDCPSPSIVPTRSPYVTYSPILSPTASYSASPSSNPTQFSLQYPNSTSDSTDVQREDRSDGRTDGRTGSLGCLRAQDHCNTQEAGISAQLPATGDFNWYLIVGAVLVLGVGILIVKYTKNKEKCPYCESDLTYWGGDREICSNESCPFGRDVSKNRQS